MTTGGLSDGMPDRWQQSARSQGDVEGFECALRITIGWLGSQCRCAGRHRLNERARGKEWGS